MLFPPQTGSLMFLGGGGGGVESLGLWLNPVGAVAGYWLPVSPLRHGWHVCGVDR